MLNQSKPYTGKYIAEERGIKIRKKSGAKQ